MLPQQQPKEADKEKLVTRLIHVEDISANLANEFKPDAPLEKIRELIKSKEYRKNATPVYTDIGDFRSKQNHYGTLPPTDVRKLFLELIVPKNQIKKLTLEARSQKKDIEWNGLALTYLKKINAFQIIKAYIYNPREISIEKAIINPIYLDLYNLARLEKVDFGVAEQAMQIIFEESAHSKPGFFNNLKKLNSIEKDIISKGIEIVTQNTMLRKQIIQQVLSFSYGLPDIITSYETPQEALENKKDTPKPKP